MAQLEITDAYTVVIVNFAEMEIQARWHGGHYVNFFANGEEFACAWQNEEVKDLDSLQAFVLDGLPFHLGIEEDEDNK
jgi:hypothetical protein